MKAQLALLNGAPNFSYQPLYKIMKGLLGSSWSEQELMLAVLRCGLRPDVKEKYTELVPLIVEYFSDKKISYAMEILPRFYAVDRDILVPFSPPLIYADENGLCLPYFIFWKKNALKGERLALFSSIVREILDEDPDLCDARFEVIDMSAEVDPDTNENERSLKIIPECDIAKISSARRQKMLSTFAEGFRRARQVAEGMPTKRRSDSDRPAPDPNQIALL